MKYGSLGLWGLSVLTAWLAWWPLREWMFSVIPSTVEWAGLAKIAVVVLIGWGGGIVVPLILLALGFVCWASK